MEYTEQTLAGIITKYDFIVGSKECKHRLMEVLPEGANIICSPYIESPTTIYAIKKFDTMDLIIGTQSESEKKRMTGTIELSEYVIDAIADAVVKKMQEPKTDTWSIKDVADTLEKHGLIAEQEPKQVELEGDGYAYGIDKKCLSCIHCEVCSFIDSDTSKLEACDFYTEGCEDAISRQAVIDVIERWLECSGYNEAERHIMRAVQSVLYDSPSVTPQSKTGHWTKVLGIFICSCCELGSSDEYDYCPHCGAKMVESEDKI